MKAKSPSGRLSIDIVVVALTILLTLGLLELFVRSFVTVRNVGPVFTVYDPIYGKRLKANFHAIHISPEFRFAFNTNSLGMRDPEPTSSVTDGVMFVGDSFTMGYGVEDNETFPAVLRANLESRAVTIPLLNTGMGLNGNGRWVKTFEYDAAKFRPRIVVFQVMANDFDDKLAEHLFELDGKGGLRELPIGPESVARKVQTLIDDTPGLPYSYLVGLALMAAEAAGIERSGGLNNTTDPTSDELTYTLVRVAVDKALASGADVIGLLVGLTGERRTKMMKIFQQRGLTCIDGPNKEESPDMFYKVDAHWNSAGHRRAAELLLPEILRLIDQPRRAPNKEDVNAKMILPEEEEESAQ
jgi:hypothetical protein